MINENKSIAIAFSLEQIIIFSLLAWKQSFVLLVFFNAALIVGICKKGWNASN